MASDRARISYDETRHYRSVVMQQGRVTLDADWNEAQAIASEELRRETLEIVGPAGTPDDGYRIQEPGTAPAIAFDFTVGNPKPATNTMYVGGLRVQADSPIHYATQLDWLDHSTDPDWLALAAVAKAPGHEWIGLVLREQEVSAVEDTALREIALGGPDTAQRTRLLQHVVRVETKASDCPGGLASATQKWASEGLAPDAATMRLLSGATLKVSFPKSKQKPDPCEPQPVGGYLGADNQLIRVQIASIDASGKAHLVWGYDNASFLYRLSVQDANDVKLLSAPPDVFRQPRENQVVEVLRAAAALGGGDYVAAHNGVLFQLGNKPYDPDTRIVTLPGSGLNATYLDTKQTPALFLRVWEESKPITPGTPILLGQTGVEVTLQAKGGKFHIGDYWQFAVRPAQQTEIYPHRYLTSAQPPDGPRLWYCPLGVIGWTDGILKVLADCRNPFDNLVDLTRTRLGGCCTVTVRPEDLVNGKTLKSVLDQYSNRERVTMCLLPGHYPLDAPLYLGAAHSNLTIEACHDGAIIEAAAGAESKFLDGLIVLDHANNVTLRGLRFHLPQVPFRGSGGGWIGLSAAMAKQTHGALIDNLRVSVGVRAVHCAMLAVEGCLFRYSLTANEDVLGVGLFCNSEIWGLKATGNRFVHEEDYLRSTGPLFRFLAGFVLAPLAHVAAPSSLAAGAKVEGAGLHPSLLHDADFTDNLFEGLTIASLAVAEFGTVRAVGNTVRDCDAGLWFLSLRLLAASPQLITVSATETYMTEARKLGGFLESATASPLVELGLGLTLGYPLPAGSVLKQATPATTKATAQPITQHFVQLQEVLDRVLPLQIGSTAPASATRMKILAREAPGTPSQPGVTPTAAPAAQAETTQSAAAATKTTKTRAATSHTHVIEAVAAGIASSKQARAGMELLVSNNVIDTIVAHTTGSAGLLVAGDPSATRGATIVSANRISSFTERLPAACLLLVEACTVTGNVFSNTHRNIDVPGVAFALYPLPTDTNTSAVAVTGNVFHGGRARLPARPATTPATPAPMDTWLFFNTEA